MKTLKLNKKQENKFSMFLAIEAVLDLFEAFVNSIAEFADSAGKLKDRIVLIQSKSSVKSTAMQGKTSAKTDKRIKVENLIIKIAAGLNAYGTKKKYFNIISITGIMTKGYLKKLRDSEILNKAKIIIDLAEPMLAKLTQFGIQELNVSNLRDARITYAESIGEKEVGSSAQSSANKSINDLLVEGSEIIENEIDNFVTESKDVKPELYQQYFALRRIKNKGVRHKEVIVQKVPEK